jgi:mannosyltransferase
MGRHLPDLSETWTIRPDGAVGDTRPEGVFATRKASSLTGSRSSLARPLAILAICAIGAYLRLDHLALQSLWQDEAFSWRITQFPWGEIISRTAADVHPPLYYLLLKGWITLLGDSVFAMRALSVLFDLAALICLYAFCVDLDRVRQPAAPGWTPRKAAFHGLCATGLFALSASEIVHAREVRMYPLAVLLAIASSWALWRALHGIGRQIVSWTSYAVLAVALSYTHYFGLFTIFAQFAFASVFLLRESYQQGTSWISSVKVRGLACAFLVITGALVPWLDVFRHQRVQVVGSYWTRPLSVPIVLGAIDHLFIGQIDIVYPYTGGLSVVLAGFLIVALFWRRQAADCYIALLAVIPLALSIFVSLAQHRNIVVGRCLTMTVPFYLVAAASLIAQLDNVAARLGLASVAYASLAGLLGIVQQDTSAMDKPGLRAAVEAIRAEYRPGDLVISAFGEHLAIRYYARGEFIPKTFFRGGRMPRHFEGASVIGAEDVVDARQLSSLEKGRVWLVVDRGTLLRDVFSEGWRSVRRYEFAESAPYRIHKIYVDLCERTSNSP